MNKSIKYLFSVTSSAAIEVNKEKFSNTVFFLFTK